VCRRGGGTTARARTNQPGMSFVNQSRSDSRRLSGAACRAPALALTGPAHGPVPNPNFYVYDFGGARYIQVNDTNGNVLGGVGGTFFTLPIGRYANLFDTPSQPVAPAGRPATGRRAKTDLRRRDHRDHGDIAAQRRHATARHRYLWRPGHPQYQGAVTRCANPTHGWGWPGCCREMSSRRPRNNGRSRGVP